MSRKLTTKEFIKKARDIHSDLYDYSKVHYVNNKTKVEIICSVHGSFLQKPNNHLNGQGCPECAKEKIAKSLKSSTQDFIKKAMTIHGDLYDYSKVNYKHSKSKVEIICRKHGSFFQQPHNHLKGYGCPECGKEKKAESLKSSTQDFIEKAKLIHGDLYDYSKVHYKNNATKVKIICPEHGSFLQIPNNHLNGFGCCKCANEKKKLTTKDFIEKARDIHGDLYDYSKVNYEHSRTKVEIICMKHGSFFQKPNGHLNGYGCPNCALENQKSSSKEFIEKAISIHGNQYDYSKVQYVNSQTKVEIICPKHGSFFQTPNVHIKFHGCPKCANEKKKLTTKDFIEKAISIHGGQYDYSKVQYKNNRTKVEIICRKHGFFLQKPNNHLNGQGCPRCPTTISKPEQEIADYIVSFGYDIIQSHRRWCSTRPQLEIDIFIPSLNLGFEFNGSYWHSKKPKGYHKEKTLLALENGIKLIHIWEEIWNNDPERVKRMIEKRISTYQR